MTRLSTDARAALRGGVRVIVQRLPLVAHRLVNVVNPYLAGDDPVIVGFEGQWMELDLRDHVQKEVYYFGRYEQTEQIVFISCLRPGMVVFDVGAHVGVYTLIAARSVGKEGRVIAFEPVPDNFRRLRRNVELNRWKNVVTEEYAVSDRGGEEQILLPCYPNSGVSSVGKFVNRGEWKGSIPVKGISLDAYCESRGIERIDLIKMDIQGGEILAIRGMRKILCGDDRQAPDLFCEIHPEWLANGFQSSALEVMELLRGNGYRAFRLLGGHVVEYLPGGSAVQTSQMCFFSKASDSALQTRFGLQVK
jgi:FkbM family methyltransferase